MMDEALARPGRRAESGCKINEQLRSRRPIGQTSRLATGPLTRSFALSLAGRTNQRAPKRRARWPAGADLFRRPSPGRARRAASTTEGRAGGQTNLPRRRSSVERALLKLPAEAQGKSAPGQVAASVPATIKPTISAAAEEGDCELSQC